MTYISIDPEPIEARIKELEIEVTPYRNVIKNNLDFKMKMHFLQVKTLYENHISDLKKIIGKK